MQDMQTHLDKLCADAAECQWKVSCICSDKFP
jgi:hypothetical protein